MSRNSLLLSLTNDQLPMIQNKIAICFFGITRSLKFTIESIEKCVIDPAREAGSVKLFSHFFNQKQIDNPRSGEKGILDTNEHRLLPSDWIALEEPDEGFAAHNVEVLKQFGDRWNDNFVSLRNLIHQLHSLDRVTTAATEWDADIYIFVRPDIKYHDSLKPYVRRAIDSSEAVLLIPDWQHGYGYNDRFAICSTKPVAIAYGQRGKNCLEFCMKRKEPLHSESLLEYSLNKEGIRPELMDAKGSRVRSNGSVRIEHFTKKKYSKLRKMLINILFRLRIINILPKMLRAEFRIKHKER